MRIPRKKSLKCSSCIQHVDLICGGQVPLCSSCPTAFLSMGRISKATTQEEASRHHQPSSVILSKPPSAFPKPKRNTGIHVWAGSSERHKRSIHLLALFSRPSLTRGTWDQKKYQVMSPDRIRVPALLGRKCLLLLCSLQMCEMTRWKSRRKWARLEMYAKRIIKAGQAMAWHDHEETQPPWSVAQICHHTNRAL